MSHHTSKWHQSTLLLQLIHLRDNCKFRFKPFPKFRFRGSPPSRHKLSEIPFFEYFWTFDVVHFQWGLNQYEICRMRNFHTPWGRRPHAVCKSRAWFISYSWSHSVITFLSCTLTYIICNCNPYLYLMPCCTKTRKGDIELIRGVWSSEVGWGAQKRVMKYEVVLRRGISSSEEGYGENSDSWGTIWILQ